MVRGSRPIWMNVLIAVLVVSACSDQTKPESEGAFSISGRVRLIGTERDAIGTPLATRFIDDASGVPVHLERDGAIIATTGTAAGTFLFEEQPPGEYRALAWVTSTDPSTTETRILDDADVVFSETMQLQRSGDLEVYANPLETHRTSCRFFLPVGRDVSLTIRDLSLNPVATLLDGYENAGVHAVPWNGRIAGHPAVVPGVYWAVLDVEGTSMCELIFVDPNAPERIPGWTISSSATDPFANSGEWATRSLRRLYLWLACGDHVESATLRLEGTFEIFSVTPVFPFAFNISTMPDVHLLAVECPGGPVVAAEILVMDMPGRICLAPDENGVNATYGCGKFRIWENAFIGYSNDGTPPCRSPAGAPCDVVGG